MPIEATILGCGSSSGVPRAGLDGPDWGACDPSNPRNRRTRCSALVKANGVTLLIDTSPDLREQLLANPPGRIDAVLLTHDHADQIHGIDDLRALVYAMRRRIQVFADADTMATVQRRFGYCFASPAGSGYPPILDAVTIDARLGPFEVRGSDGSVTIVPFAQVHGPITSLGYRIGGFAYSSDVSALDDTAFGKLEGTECWVVDALRDAPHPTHSHVAQSLTWIERIAPRHAVLTNMHIDLDYAALSARLPLGVEAAYDGMRCRTAT